MAPVAIPPQFQSGHQTGKEEANSQDAEDTSKAVQFEGLAICLGAGMADEVTAAHVWPPLLLEYIQVPGVLQLQDPTKYNPHEPQMLASSIHHEGPGPFPIMLAPLQTTWNHRSSSLP